LPAPQVHGHVTTLLHRLHRVGGSGGGSGRGQRAMLMVVGAGGGQSLGLAGLLGKGLVSHQCASSNRAASSSGITGKGSGSMVMLRTGGRPPGPPRGSAAAGGRL